MKFCSITPDYTRASCDSIEVDLPFELTEEQHNVIVFPRSTFLFGRSGTGKTTVLTTKMIRNEKLHRLAVGRVYGPYSNASESSERSVLRQLFVTLSLDCAKRSNTMLLVLKGTCLLLRYSLFVHSK
jgi:hypothetical protein